MLQTFHLLLIILLFSLSFGQSIGISPTQITPNASAKLDIDVSSFGATTKKSLLLPRVALSSVLDVISIPSPAVSLLVFNTGASGVVPNDVVPSYYYWSGSKWIAFTGSGSNDWTLTGNTGTTAGTNFVGTFDSQAFDIRTNNIIRSRITTKGQIEIYNTGQSVFIGEGAGANDDLATRKNSFIGYQSGFSNTSGSGNSTIGWEALYANTTGTNHNAFRVNSLVGNTTGVNNNAFGVSALAGNTTGVNNNAFGTGALSSNTTGIGNSVFGSGLGFSTTGSYNSVFGSNALTFNSTGSYNTGSGYSALLFLTTGSNNCGYGAGVLGSFSGESYNTGMGANALRVSAGSYNVAIGYQVLSNNNTGNSNTVVGSKALKFNLKSSNVAFGDSAAYQTGASVPAAEGIHITAIGSNALRTNTSGTGNTALGYHTGYGINTGSGNTLLGKLAGAGIIGTALTTGNNNTLIAYNSNVNNATLSNATAIGCNARVDASNALVLGGTGSDAVYVGIGTPNPATTLDVNGIISLWAQGTSVSLSGGGMLDLSTNPWSYLKISSASAISPDGTTSISNGQVSGQLLILQNTNATDAITISDNSNVQLTSGSYSMGSDDTLMLIWNGTD